MKKVLAALAILIGVCGQASAQVIPFSLGPQPIPPQWLLSQANVWTATNTFSAPNGTLQFNCQRNDNPGANGRNLCAFNALGYSTTGVLETFTTLFFQQTVATNGSETGLFAVNLMGGNGTPGTGNSIFLCTGGASPTCNMATNAALTSGTSNGWYLSAGAASATAPGFAPNATDLKAGIGANTGGNVSIITDAAGTAVETVRVSPSGITFLGTIPTATGTGTPVVTTGSTDDAGSVIAGASATSVIITSGNAGYTTAPFCNVTPVTQLVAFSAPVTVSAGRFVITITQTATSGDLITWHCNKNT